MKTERRHELQTNTLADWMGKRIEALRPYSTGIVGAVVLVVVVIGAFTYWRSQTRTNQRLGWEQLLSFASGGSPQSLANVAEQFPDSSVGSFARLQMGNVQLNSGINQLFADPAEGKDQLRKAIETFQLVQNDASEPLLQQHAVYGLARAHESLNHLQEAEQYYEELEKKWVDGVYAETARRRLADLRRPETKKFYDWLDAQEPLASATGGPGQAGTRVPFDPGSLPDEPGELSPFDTPRDTIPTESPAESPSGEGVTTDESDDTPETPPADDSSGKAPPDDSTSDQADAKGTATDDSPGEGGSPTESPDEPE